MFILDDDDSATGLGTELERSRAEIIPERSAPVTGHLRAATLMAGPFVWAGVLLAGVAAIDSATTGSSGGATESLFADVVARAGNPADRDEALAELSRLIEESTPARPSLEWVSDFEANVMPLYSSLWDDEPRRRSQILSHLRRGRIDARRGDLARHSLAGRGGGPGGRRADDRRHPQSESTGELTRSGRLLRVGEILPRGSPRASGRPRRHAGRPGADPPREKGGPGVGGASTRDSRSPAQDPQWRFSAASTRRCC